MPAAIAAAGRGFYWLPHKQKAHTSQKHLYALNSKIPRNYHVTEQNYPPRAIENCKNATKHLYFVAFFAAQKIKASARTKIIVLLTFCVSKVALLLPNKTDSPPF